MTTGEGIASDQLSIHIRLFVDASQEIILRTRSKRIKSLQEAIYMYKLTAARVCSYGNRNIAALIRFVHSVSVGERFPRSLQLVAENAPILGTLPMWHTSLHIHQSHSFECHICVFCIHRGICTELWTLTTPNSCHLFNVQCLKDSDSSRVTRTNSSALSTLQWYARSDHQL